MPIIFKTPPNPTHSCELPENPGESYGTGTVFQCDGCGQQYRLDFVREIYTDRYVFRWLPLKNPI